MFSGKGCRCDVGHYCAACGHKARKGITGEEDVSAEDASPEATSTTAQSMPEPAPEPAPEVVPEEPQPEGS